MPRPPGPRAPLVELLKILLLVAIFYGLQEQVLGLRGELYGNRAGVAHAEGRPGASRETEERSLAAMSDCRIELERATRDLEDSRAALQAEREGLFREIDARSGRLEASVSSRFEKERGELESVRYSLAAGASRLERLASRLPRDSREMRRKMIQPTVQLKGNGTVGSGVIVYSEPQIGSGGEAERFSPGGREGGTGVIHSTFILTAHHVVIEVLGDRLDTGTLEEVHILSSEESDASEVFSAKLFLFDRARDVALLRVNSTREFERKVEWMPREALESIDVFTRAYAVGCPLGNKPLPTIGEISSKSKIVSDQVFWMLSAPTFFGNSGGGIYLADDCRFIGVSSMIYTYGKTHPSVVPHMGLFVPLQTIYTWLDAEGYSFIHERRPIPRELLWKLVYTETQTPVPRTASGPAEK
ncbi:MAG TPA: serine protease [Planctomycetota bacterium]|nr:serine protease [Planctomycetota bacterium]